MKKSKRRDKAIQRMLPREFALGHDLAFVLHDLLAEYVVEGEKNQLQFFKVDLHRPEDAEVVNGLEGEALWEWCEANGYREVLDEHSYRSLIFALLADMCQFLYEGLKCSEKGKLAVAFSNFRKPLQDNLYFLEWILADWPGFLGRFRGGPEEIDTSRLGDLRKSTRLDVIAKAMDKTSFGRWLDPEWLYELRYEKASNFGLDRTFNHAIHLVTNFKHYATSTENLNFIFCNDEDRKALWERLYLFLPAVLMHALYVVRALFKTIAPEFEPRDGTCDLWLIAGFLLWTEASCSHAAEEAAAAKIIGEMLAESELTCPECGEKLTFDNENLRRFWNDGEIQCRKCEVVLPIFEPTHVASR
jgi:hypothetical protein